MSNAYESVKISEFFNNVSSFYDPWFQKDIHYLEMLEKIVETLKKYNPSSIIELGCGSGNLTRLLADFFFAAEITAVDVSTELLDIAGEKCSCGNNVKFVKEDMLSFMTKQNKATCVVGNLSLHHLTDKEKQTLVYSISETIGKNNAFVIGDVFIEFADSPEREQAVLDTFYARCSYYLQTVSLDRAIFELEHVPMILRKEQEYLVSEVFWKECSENAGLHLAESSAAGPAILGNKILEITIC